MSNQVQFEEDDFKFSSNKTKSNPSNLGNVSAGYGHPQYNNGEQRGMAGWLVRHGIANSSTMAQGLLIFFIIINITVTYILLKYFL